MELSHKNLSNILSNDIHLLTHLTNLNITNNSTDDPFPTTIFNLFNLHTLGVNNNTFINAFTTNISTLQLLLNFNAYSNNFTTLLLLELAELPLLEEINLVENYSFKDPSLPQHGSFINLCSLNLQGKLLCVHSINTNSMGTTQHVSLVKRTLAIVVRKKILHNKSWPP